MTNGKKRKSVEEVGIAVAVAVKFKRAEALRARFEAGLVVEEERGPVSSSREVLRPGRYRRGYVLPTPWTFPKGCRRMWFRKGEQETQAAIRSQRHPWTFSSFDDGRRSLA